MQSFDYARSRSSADRLIERFGQAGAIRRTGAATGDAWNPTPSAPADHPCTLVVDDYEAGEIDGSLIRQTDRKVLVSAEGLGIEPTAADRLVIGGSAMEIVNVRPLSPGGVVVLFEIQGRA